MQVRYDKTLLFGDYSHSGQTKNHELCKIRLIKRERASHSYELFEKLGK